jgi:hypothetical protein
MSWDIIAALVRKDADASRIAGRVIGQPDLVPVLAAALEDRRARVKYGAEKVLRAVSERRPDLLEPYFDEFVRLLRADNCFIRWGAIRTTANLVAAGPDHRAQSVFRKFFAPITGPDMVTAATTIGAGATIARAKPAMADRVVKEILKVETAAYELHGEPSPECRNVACGHAIDALDALCGECAPARQVVEFVRRQLGSTRPAVRRKAAAFMKKHGP